MSHYTRRFHVHINNTSTNKHESYSFNYHRHTAPNQLHQVQQGCHSGEHSDSVVVQKEYAASTFRIKVSGSDHAPSPLSSLLIHTVTPTGGKCSTKLLASTITFMYAYILSKTYLRVHHTLGVFSETSVTEISFLIILLKQNLITLKLQHSDLCHYFIMVHSHRCFKHKLYCHTSRDNNLIKSGSGYPVQASSVYLLHLTITLHESFLLRKVFYIPS